MADPAASQTFPLADFTAAQTKFESASAKSLRAASLWSVFSVLVVASTALWAVQYERSRSRRTR